MIYRLRFKEINFFKVFDWKLNISTNLQVLVHISQYGR
jgi:hypothetical protein